MGRRRWGRSSRGWNPYKHTTSNTGARSQVTNVLNHEGPVPVINPMLAVRNRMMNPPAKFHNTGPANAPTFPMFPSTSPFIPRGPSMLHPPPPVQGCIPYNQNLMPLHQGAQRNIHHINVQQQSPRNQSSNKKISNAALMKEYLETHPDASNEELVYLLKRVESTEETKLVPMKYSIPSSSHQQQQYTR